MKLPPVGHLLAALLTSAALLVSGCSSTTGSIDSASEPVEPTTSSEVITEPDQDVTETTAQATTPVPESVEWEALPDETITLGDDDLTINQGGTYTLTGNSTSQVIVNTDQDVQLVLDDIRIVSDIGAAIVVEEADNVFITLAEGSDNYLEDAGTRSDEEIDGTLYSTADLTISGSGTLTVKANYEDGVVTKDDLVIESGIIVIDAADEGIRGRDSVSIFGGDITITAGGDGVKSTRSEEVDRGYIYISGGSLVITAGDDAIKAATTMTIDNGTINILDSYEGLEAVNITINGGDITLYADDDGINAVAGDIVADVFIAVNGGVVDVAVGPGDTDAFDSNGSIIITNGTINVTAPTSSFDYDDTAEMTGGTITVNGERLTAIPEGRRGGGGRG